MQSRQNMNEIIDKYETTIKSCLMMRMKTQTMLLSATRAIDPRLQASLSQAKSKENFEEVAKSLKEVKINYGVENSTSPSETI